MKALYIHEQKLKSQKFTFTPICNSVTSPDFFAATGNIEISKPEGTMNYTISQYSVVCSKSKTLPYEIKSNKIHLGNKQQFHRKEKEKYWIT